MSYSDIVVGNYQINTLNLFFTPAKIVVAGHFAKNPGPRE